MKKTLLDFDFRDKKVLVRCDFNVPIHGGNIIDDTRIRASLKTLNYILKKGGSLIILSHLGKVKCEADKIKNDLYPVSIRLGELLEREVVFSKHTRGKALEEMVSKLQAGDVLLIQNTRYEDFPNKLESSCDGELSKYWASLADVFINDAYATCHRAHASNVGVSKFLDSGLGFLVMDEIEKLDCIINEDSHPFVVVMGGSKVVDKIRVIENLVLKCDKLLIGGAMAYTFLYALGEEIGKSLLDRDSIDFCKKILAKYGDKIVLPVDNRVSLRVDSDTCRVKKISQMQEGDIGLDIGPLTIELFQNHLDGAKRVIVNGPMGMFEREVYAEGTKEIYRYLANRRIKTLVGGGDSVAAVNQFCDASRFYHISTGGGATLEYLEGTILAGIDAIDEK